MHVILQFGLWTLVALPVLLILVVLAAAVYAQSSFKRSISLAALAPCPKCGKPLGRAAVLAGKERYSQKIQEMMKKHSGVKFRLVAEWEIECPHCGFRLYFYPSRNQIVATSIFADKARRATAAAPVN